MTLQYRHVELAILILGLFFSFFYYAVRAVVFDGFFWIAITPGFATIYVIAAGRRYTSVKLNLLDWAVLGYGLYGVAAFFLAVFVLDAPLTLEIKVLIHYYLPLLLYITARRYTERSISRVATVMRLVTLLAVILVIDFAIESYITITLHAGASIPWVASYIGDLSTANSSAAYETYNSDRVLTVLRGAKKPGMTAAVLFAATLPFLYLQRQRALETGWAQSLLFSRPVMAALPIALAFIAFRTANDTAALTAGVAAIVAIMAVRNGKSFVIALSFFGLAFFLFASQFATIIQNQFIHQADFTTGQQTAFEYTVNPQGIIDTFASADGPTWVLGAHITGSNEAWRGSSPTSIEGSTELRAALIPIYFGLGWAVIVVIGLGTAVRMAIQIASRPTIRWFGVSLLGAMFVYAADLHYPSGLQHGPFELLWVLLGALSSLSTLDRPSPTQEAVQEFRLAEIGQRSAQR